MGGKSAKYAESWTPERRRKQRDWMLENKPWLKSTGPISEEGKKKSSQNATNHFVKTSLKTLDKIMKRQEKVLQLLRSDVAMEEHMKEIEDEITGIKRIIRGSGTEQK